MGENPETTRRRRRPLPSSTKAEDTNVACKRCGANMRDESRDRPCTGGYARHDWEASKTFLATLKEQFPDAFAPELIDGIDVEVAADDVLLSVAYSPVLPYPGGITPVEVVELEGGKYRVFFPDNPDAFGLLANTAPEYDAAAIRVMRARFLLRKANAQRHYPTMPPEMQRHVERAFFDGRPPFIAAPGSRLREVMDTGQPLTVDLKPGQSHEEVLRELFGEAGVPEGELRVVAVPRPPEGPPPPTDAFQPVPPVAEPVTPLPTTYPTHDGAPAPRWAHGVAADRSGMGKYLHMIRGPSDPERSDIRALPEELRDRMARWRREFKKAPPEVFEEPILRLLADLEPRTWNRICVELWDKTADIMHGTGPETALWALVARGQLEHTMETPILFRPRGPAPVALDENKTNAPAKSKASRRKPKKPPHRPLKIKPLTPEERARFEAEEREYIERNRAEQGEPGEYYEVEHTQNMHCDDPKAECMFYIDVQPGPGFCSCHCRLCGGEEVELPDGTTWLQDGIVYRTPARQDARARLLGLLAARAENLAGHPTRKRRARTDQRKPASSVPNPAPKGPTADHPPDPQKKRAGRPAKKKASATPTGLVAEAWYSVAELPPMTAPSPNPALASYQGMPRAVFAVWYSSEKPNLDAIEPPDELGIFAGAQCAVEAQTTADRHIRLRKGPRTLAWPLPRAFADKVHREGLLARTTSLTAAGRAALEELHLDPEDRSLTDRDVQKRYRQVVSQNGLHPDKGGDPSAFEKVTRTRDLAIEYVRALAQTKGTHVAFDVKAPRFGKTAKEFLIAWWMEHQTISTATVRTATNPTVEACLQVLTRKGYAEAISTLSRPGEERAYKLTKKGIKKAVKLAEERDE